MVVRFTWQPEEWREAYLLCTRAPSRAAGSVSMGYLIVGLMALGGVGDVVHALRGHTRGMVHGTLLPVLLSIAGVMLLLAAGAVLLHRRRRYRGLPNLPTAGQELVMHELGWRAGDDDGTTAVREWSELRGQRVGPRVFALLARDGRTVGVPLRAVTPEQGEWMQRMVSRKVPRQA